jgi:hypothetical protein
MTKKTPFQTQTSTPMFKVTTDQAKRHTLAAAKTNLRTNILFDRYDIK